MVLKNGCQSHNIIMKINLLPAHVLRVGWETENLLGVILLNLLPKEIYGCW